MLPQDRLPAVCLSLFFCVFLNATQGVEPTNTPDPSPSVQMHSSTTSTVTTGGTIATSTDTNGRVSVTITTIGPDGKAQTFSVPPVGPPPAALATDGSSKKSADDVSHGRPQGPRERVTWMGVATQDAPPVLSRQLGFMKGSGLVVTEVAKGSPAQKAGIEPYDILLRMGDQILVNAPQFKTLVHARAPGEKAIFTLLRNGKESTVEVLLEQHEEEVEGGRPREEPPFQLWTGKSSREAAPFQRFTEPPPGPGFREMEEGLRRLQRNREGLQNHRSEPGAGPSQPRNQPPIQTR